MRKIYLLPFTLILLAFSCETKKKATSFRIVAPEAGSLIGVGNDVSLKLFIPERFVAFDSIQYILDDKLVVSKQDSSQVAFAVDASHIGTRTVRARLYQAGEAHDAVSNIVVVPPAPQKYAFEIVNEFPHRTDAYTQGLEMDPTDSNIIYESTGQYGSSSLRRVDLRTGEVLKKIELEDRYFGEGFTMVGDKIILLTWRENTGFVYHKNTLERISQFAYGQQREGWGICYDGERLIKSNGTNRLYFLNKDTFADEGHIDVYNHLGPLRDELNELEYIDGLVYANSYQKDIIVAIDPRSGAVVKEINLIGLYPEKEAYDNELNGIAYDGKQDRLFVTGKRWPKLFEIKLIAQ